MDFGKRSVFVVRGIKKVVFFRFCGINRGLVRCLGFFQHFVAKNQHNQE
jgi:hypothetical protein